MRIPKPGDVLVFRRDTLTAGGNWYEKGDEMTLIEPTADAPFGYESALCNWRVRCKFHEPPAPESVWSSIWMGLEDGTWVIK